MGVRLEGQRVFFSFSFFFVIQFYVLRLVYVTRFVGCEVCYATIGAMFLPKCQ
jgi:hypothetical protein